MSEEKPAESPKSVDYVEEVKPPLPKSVNKLLTGKPKPNVKSVLKGGLEK